MLLKFLYLLLFPIALATAKQSLVQQQEKLAELAKAGNGRIKLDQSSFELLVNSKRTWSASIQFTALDKRRRCAPCKEFQPSWDAVAQAWSKVPKDVRDTHFFGTLDFDDAPAVFQQLGLASAPVVYVYPAADGPRATGKTSPSKYDFTHGFEPLPLAQHLSNHTPIPIPYKAPFDYAFYLSAFAGVAGFAALLRFISPILQSRWTWAAGTVLTSLIMTGGYMFTRIRGVPYTNHDGNWIAGGYQNQFGQEVHVIALIYGTLAFSFLMLTVVIPYQASPGRQRVQVYIWNAVIMLVFSVLVTLFRVKNRGYPFRLLL